MKFLIASLALVCAIQIVSAAPADEVDCSKLDEVYEDRGAASAGISFTTDKYGVLLTKDDLDRRCPDMNDALKTLKRYNAKCHAGQTQQVLSAALKTRQEFTDKMCKDTGSAENSKRLDAIKCIVDNAKNNARDAEMRALLTSQVLSESQFKDDNERIKRTCCASFFAKEDLQNQIRGPCEKSLPIVNEYVDSYLGEALGLVCPDFDKMLKDGECQKLGQTPIQGVSPKYSFMLVPVVKAIRAMEH